MQRRDKVSCKSETLNDPIFERKLESITEDTPPYLKSHLLEKIMHVNCQVIIAYILAMQIEVNPKPSYRIETILKVKQLAEFHHPKDFKEMTRGDIIAFLDRLRKSESAD